MVEFLSQLIGLEPLFQHLIKSTVVLSFGIFLSYLCRKQPAALRHFILSVSLIGLLIFPLLSAVNLGWKTGLLPSFKNEFIETTPLDVSSINDRTHPLAFIEADQEEVFDRQ